MPPPLLMHVDKKKETKTSTKNIIPKLFIFLIFQTQTNLLSIHMYPSHALLNPKGIIKSTHTVHTHYTHTNTL